MSKKLEASMAALVASTSLTPAEVELSGGASVPVRGLSVLQFIDIIRSFPTIRTTLLSMVGMADKQMLEAESEKSAAEIVEILLDAGPEALATVVAVGMGFRRSDTAAVEQVMSLPDEDLFKLLERIIELTMPTGVADFFGRFAGLAAKMGLAVPAASGGEASPAI